jgi:adenosylcobinamide kinase/adenosylcobinamide-phosphate guanylyltransferase
MIPHDLTFVLGGARSGKSAHAERLAADSGRPVTYVATATPSADDAEFERRIAHHRARRPADWGFAAAPVDLAGTLARLDDPHACVLVDCLTLWLTICCARSTANRSTTRSTRRRSSGSSAPCASAREGDRRQQRNRARRRADGRGHPPLRRRTRPLNQRIAALATRVTLLVAGCR